MCIQLLERRESAPPPADDRINFDDFYRTMHPVCHHVLRRGCRKLVDSQLLTEAELDEAVTCAVQDTFHLAHRLWDRYDPSRARRVTWLLMLARQRLSHVMQYSTRHARHRARAEEAETCLKTASTFDGAPGVLLTLAIEDTLSRLAPSQAEALRLHYLQGFSVIETAARMRTTQVAVQSLLQRGRQAFRKHWSGSSEDGGLPQ